MTINELPDRNHLPALLNSMGCVNTGVEVGVYKGQFSNLILSGWPGCLIGVDSYNRGTDFHLLMNAVKRNEQFIHEGRYRLVVNDSVQASELVPSNLDFVYLDADHDYKAVRSDIYCWYPKVKQGGIFGGHDYTLEAGVENAVAEFINREKLEFVIKKCGSWFVIKP